MKSKKKLSLKKMNIAQLDVIRGGEIGNTINNTRPRYTVISYVNCGNRTQADCTNDTGIACQYSAAPTSCIVCVDIER